MVDGGADERRGITVTPIDRSQAEAGAGVRLAHSASSQEVPTAGTGLAAAHQGEGSALRLPGWGRANSHGNFRLEGATRRRQTEQVRELYKAHARGMPLAVQGSPPTGIRRPAAALGPKGRQQRAGGPQGGAIAAVQARRRRAQRLQAPVPLDGHLGRVGGTDAAQPQVMLQAGNAVVEHAVISDFGR